MQPSAQRREGAIHPKQVGRQSQDTHTHTLTWGQILIPRWTLPILGLTPESSREITKKKKKKRKKTSACVLVSHSSSLLLLASLGLLVLFRACNNSCVGDDSSYSQGHAVYKQITGANPWTQPVVSPATGGCIIHHLQKKGKKKQTQSCFSKIGLSQFSMCGGAPSSRSSLPLGNNEK